jgi:uncharacterized protein (TIGR03083 family)
MTCTSVDEVPPITRSDAEPLAAAEYHRLADLLHSLDAADWARPTDCPTWDVRAVAGHCVGMMSDFTSFGSVIRRMSAGTRAAKRDGGAVVDAVTAMQVEAHATLTTDEIVAAIERRGPEAARWRAGVPGLLRALPMRERVDGRPETWRLSFLLDTILTRDPWMHRVDIARATDREPVLTPEHDGRIVADVVAEWARRHGRPFDLDLTGPAGGRFRADGTGGAGGAAGAGGADGGLLTLDAVEFCRILSGRAHGTGLLAQPVPF